MIYSDRVTMHLYIVVELKIVIVCYKQNMFKQEKRQINMRRDVFVYCMEFILEWEQIINVII